MATITVTGRANLGFSPKFGDIKKDQKYTIEESDFAIELFNAPKGFDTAPFEPQPDVVADQSQPVVIGDQINQEVL